MVFWNTQEARHCSSRFVDISPAVGVLGALREEEEAATQQYRPDKVHTYRDSPSGGRTHLFGTVIYRVGDEYANGNKELIATDICKRHANRVKVLRANTKRSSRDCVWEKSRLCTMAPKWTRLRHLNRL